MKKVVEISHQEINRTCLQLLAKEIDFIEGCRKIVALVRQLNLEIEPYFTPFIGVVSETDDYLSGMTRESFSESYLEKLDRDIFIYTSQVQSSIFDACKQVIANYKL